MYSCRKHTVSAYRRFPHARVLVSGTIIRGWEHLHNTIEAKVNIYCGRTLSPQVMTIRSPLPW